MIVKFETTAAEPAVSVVSRDRRRYSTGSGDCRERQEPQAGRGWGKPSEVTTLTVSGLPAARSTTRPRTTVFRRGEITGVRRGGQVFYFIATYQLGDRNARKNAARP